VPRHLDFGWISQQERLSGLKLVTKEVTLVAIAEERHVYGLNSLVNGALDSPSAKTEALEKMQALGFGMAQQEDTE